MKGGDFDDVITAFQQGASHYVPLTPEEWLAIDGKALAATVTE